MLLSPLRQGYEGQHQAARPFIRIIVKEDLETTAPQKSCSSAELFISDFCDLHVADESCDLHFADQARDLHFAEEEEACNLHLRKKRHLPGGRCLINSFQNYSDPAPVRRPDAVMLYAAAFLQQMPCMLVFGRSSLACAAENFDFVLDHVNDALCAGSE